MVAASFWWRHRCSVTSPTNERVMTATTSSMLQPFRRFGRDRRGVSAVEFAFIAPMMIGLYLGCVEISSGVAADREVSLIAGALANLTAQEKKKKEKKRDGGRKK